MEAGDARTRVPGRADDFLDVTLPGFLDGCQLKVCFEPKWANRPLLLMPAHGEPPDAEPVEAVDRGQVGGGLKDRLPGLGPVARVSRHPAIV